MRSTRCIGNRPAESGTLEKRMQGFAQQLREARSLAIGGRIVGMRWTVTVGGKPRCRPIGARSRSLPGSKAAGG